MFNKGQLGLFNAYKSKTFHRHNFSKNTKNISHFSLLREYSLYTHDSL